MRTVLTVGVSVFLGIVLGVLVARFHFGNKIAEMAKTLEESAREKERLTAELQFAAERLRYMENDYAALQKQLETLGTSRSAVAVSAHGAGGDSGDVAMLAGDAAGTNVAKPDAASSGTPSGQDGAKRTIPEVEIRLEQDRVRVQDFLQTQIETTSDPAEQARLTRLQEDMQVVRDLFDQLREAQSSEERQNVIRQMARVRGEMRDIILEQRAALVRQTLEQAGVTDTAQQQHLIAALEELQNSPYYTDQMLIWGMAPKPLFGQ